MANTENYTPRYKTLYKEEVLPALMKEMKVKSPMAAPKLEKIVINIGVADAREDIKFIDIAKEDLTAITGQAAQIRRAKKSISNFKLREGMPIGVRVTLRGDRMYEFFDRFVNIVAPRIRDFQGFNGRGFDGRGSTAPPRRRRICSSRTSGKRAASAQRTAVLSI